MKSNNFLFKKTLCMVLFLMLNFVYAQTDITKDTKLNMNHDWGKTQMEKGELTHINQTNQIPRYLLEQYKQAKISRNDNEKAKIGNEIQSYLEPSNKVIDRPEESTFFLDKPPAPFNEDWYNNDVLIHTGDIAFSNGYRQIDMKYGEDGCLYLAFNRRNVSGYLGMITVYRSSNGGMNWTPVGSVANGSAYFGTMSMLVEKRHASLDDSARVLLFYNRSPNSNFDDASLECASFRRDGTTFYISHFAIPASGNKYEYPSACSDGMYYNTATYMHVVAREVTNSNTQVGLRHFLSTDWGISYTTTLLNTGFIDAFPSIAYSEKSTTTDSIYIAVERRISTTDYDIRAIITSEWPTAAYYVYYITSAPNVKYEKPAITVQQQHYSQPRRVLITCTKSNIAVYHGSTNGGQTWVVDAALGSTNMLTDFTSCNSDSLTSGGGYFMASFVDQNGDSITIRRGIIGSLGGLQLKRNSVMSTGMLAPACAIFKSGTNKYSAFAYAGQGPSNIYFNQENLQTGIKPIGEVPVKFELQQNYPNPFNPATTIKFSIIHNDNVSLKIYDILGNEVATLVNEKLMPDSYEIKWDASRFASGVYFSRLQAGNYIDVKKMMLVK